MSKVFAVVLLVLGIAQVALTQLAAVNVAVGPIDEAKLYGSVEPLDKYAVGYGGINIDTSGRVERVDEPVVVLPTISETAPGVENVKDYYFPDDVRNNRVDNTKEIHTHTAQRKITTVNNRNLHRYIKNLLVNTLYNTYIQRVNHARLKNLLITNLQETHVPKLLVKYTRTDTVQDVGERSEAPIVTNDVKSVLLPSVVEPAVAEKIGYNGLPLAPTLYSVPVPPPVEQRAAFVIPTETTTILQPAHPFTTTVVGAAGVSPQIFGQINAQIGQIGDLTAAKLQAQSSQNIIEAAIVQAAQQVQQQQQQQQQQQVQQQNAVYFAPRPQITAVPAPFLQQQQQQPVTTAVAAPQPQQVQQQFFQPVTTIVQASSSQQTVQAQPQPQPQPSIIEQQQQQTGQTFPSVSSAAEPAAAAAFESNQQAQSQQQQQQQPLSAPPAASEPASSAQTQAQFPTAAQSTPSQPAQQPQQQTQQTAGATTNNQAAFATLLAAEYAQNKQPQPVSQHTVSSSSNSGETASSAATGTTRVAAASGGSDAMGQANIENYVVKQMAQERVLLQPTVVLLEPSNAAPPAAVEQQTTQPQPTEQNTAAAFPQQQQQQADFSSIQPQTISTPSFGNFYSGFGQQVQGTNNPASFASYFETLKTQPVSSLQPAWTLAGIQRSSLQPQQQQLQQQQLQYYNVPQQRTLYSVGGGAAVGGALDFGLSETDAFRKSYRLRL